MRYFLFFLVLVVAVPASANEYYYVVYNIPTLDGVRFASPDAACQSAYEYDQTVKFPSWAGDNKLDALPYVPPYVYQSFPPKLLTYKCDTAATLTFLDSNGVPTGETYEYENGYTINRQGNNCNDTQYYNPVSGLCQTSDEEQPRKQLGNTATLVGSVGCGDPINIGTGNMFDEETDFVDADGELALRRTYNSQIGRWQTNYSARITADSFSMALIAADGRQTVFSLENNVATPEPGETGSMVYKNGLWTYTSPSNEIMTFGSLGRLVAWTGADGRTQTISYVDDASFNSTATVTDSQGHKLTFKSNVSGQVSQVSVGSLVVSYQFDATNRMVSVTRQWPNHSTGRTYLYEDSKHPTMLTGVIDERGVRSATWAYDAMGRAVENERAGGAAKVTIAYADDGSATVSNVFGQKTVYHYEVVQGVKRVVAIEGSPAPGCPAANSSYTYTPLGEIASKTDARGSVTTYTYDDLGREIRRVEASGSPNERVISTGWDGASFRPATVTTSDRVTTYAYDDKGRLLSTSVRAIKE